VQHTKKLLKPQVENGDWLNIYCMLSFRKWLVLREEVIPRWQTDKMAVFARSGIKQEDIALLQKATAGVWTAMEWIKTKPVQNGYSLGLTNDDYDVAAGLTNAEHWKRAYQMYSQYKGAYTSDTDNVLTKLGESGKPVVFFIPNPKKGQGNTNQELEWVLDKCRTNPELVKNYYIVIGLYDLIDQDHFKKQVGQASLYHNQSHVYSGVLAHPDQHLMSGDEPNAPDKSTLDRHLTDLEKMGKTPWEMRPGVFYTKGTSGHE
jgi:hypothetical protein